MVNDRILNEGHLRRSQKTRTLEADIRRLEDILRSAGIDPGESVFDPEPIDDDDEAESDMDDYDSSNHLSSDYSSASPEERKSFESVTTPQSASSVTVESPSQALVLKTDRGREGIFFGKQGCSDIAYNAKVDVGRVFVEFPHLVRGRNSICPREIRRSRLSYWPTSTALLVIY